MSICSTSALSRGTLFSGQKTSHLEPVHFSLLSHSQELPAHPTEVLHPLLTRLRAQVLEQMTEF